MKRTLLIVTILLLLSVVFVGSAAAQELAPQQYIVQPGDSLSSIAFEYCTIWQDIYRYNSGTIGDDPNSIAPSMVLYVIDRCDQGDVYDRGPRQHAMGTTSGQFYTVTAGDTLYSVGERFGLNYKIIMLANNMTSTAVMTPGQQLYIPGFKANHVPTSITINSPQDGDIYRLPYVATGTGQGLVEGNVVVRLLDGNGYLMAQQQTVLQGADVGTGGFGTWQVTFYNVVGQPKSNGSIEAFSPETGATDVVYFLFSGY